MKKSFLLLFPALLLVSCESAAPIIISNPRPEPSYPSSPTSYTPSSTAPAPVTRTTYAYPNIAGVWKSDIATITIAPSSGGPFTITIAPNPGRNRAKVHSVTAHWGQPYHKHFRYFRETGTEVICTVTSLTPNTITARPQNGDKEQIWRKITGM